MDVGTFGWTLALDGGTVGWTLAFLFLKFPKFWSVSFYYFHSFWNNSGTNRRREVSFKVVGLPGHSLHLSKNLTPFCFGHNSGTRRRR